MNVAKSRENKAKYKQPPTLEQIDRVLRIMRLRERELEALWSIPQDTIKRIRYNGRKLPFRYAHWFYDVLWVYEDIDI